MIRPGERRKRAAQACLDRFRGKPYAPGKRDCPTLALHALRQVGVRVEWAKGLRWKDEAEGLRVLNDLGFKDLIAAMDSLGLPRIAPAMAMAADIIAIPTDHKVGALSVCVGNGNVLAFTGNSANAEVLTGLTDFVTDENGPCAWRVING